jgi:RNA polymerase sigma-70 factor (ECF subfamily)
MMRRHPRLERWAESDDVFQNAMLRLCRALERMTPESPRHFFNLAAQQIRRELIDLSRHYFGPQGPAALHATPQGIEQGSNGPARAEAAEAGGDRPEHLAEWSELHAAVEGLPAVEREVFSLIWYHDLTRSEVGKLLGLSARTVIRHWNQARVRLLQLLQGELPAP